VLSFGKSERTLRTSPHFFDAHLRGNESFNICLRSTRSSWSFFFSLPPSLSLSLSLSHSQMLFFEFLIEELLQMSELNEDLI
jgi:hypothetical protein